MARESPTAGPMVLFLIPHGRADVVGSFSGPVAPGDPGFPTTATETLARNRTTRPSCAIAPGLGQTSWNFFECQNHGRTGCSRFHMKPLCHQLSSVGAQGPAGVQIGKLIGRAG